MGLFCFFHYDFLPEDCLCSFVFLLIEKWTCVHLVGQGLGGGGGVPLPDPGLATGQAAETARTKSFL